MPQNNLKKSFPFVDEVLNFVDSALFKKRRMGFPPEDLTHGDPQLLSGSRHPTFYFDDGDVALVVGITHRIVFRVHQRDLELHSKFFYNMFRIGALTSVLATKHQVNA
jgi:hypothetical protein